MTARKILRVACVALAVAVSACSSAGAHVGSAAKQPLRPHSRVITVGSFDFPESVLLAEIYGKALAAAKLPVRILTNLGPRELVDSALMNGLIQIVPEYAGSALEFFSLGRVYAAYRLFSHVHERVDIWLHPWSQAQGHAYQLVQGLFGLGTGGVLGTGLGLGRPDLVPYAKTDFITATIGEELGLAGLMAVLVVYGLVIQRGLRSAVAVRDTFGKLLVTGLAFSLALQVFVVVGGVTRLIPLTGMTLPFLSYGGSSLVANWVIVALMVRVSDAARRPVQQAAVPTGPPGDVTQVIR